MAEREEEQAGRIGNPGWKDLAADWYPETLLKDGVPVQFSTKHKIPEDGG
jgi:hypothetical protein